MEWLSDPQAWISLLTLTGLEIVLGIDNIIFISILAGKLPQAQQAKARQSGLMLALITRILLLCGIAWMARLTTPLFTLVGHGVSGRDLILLCGGLFLIVKSTMEIHEKLEGEDGQANPTKAAAKFGHVLVQIMLLDIVFSLDSVITAVGMAQHLPVMIIAVILAMGVMLMAAGTISEFVNRHPTLKVLALSFLILIGVTLIAEGTGVHVPKGYVYFAMAFSFGVEMINLRLRKKSKPVELHQPYR
ncbi:MAG: TerC family protein [Opitutaceae bacterium]|nr:TerC family protein [Opitutaceae bacterium]MBP9913355.1 TerC family protein [Opitutaceae bacterium]